MEAEFLYDMPVSKLVLMGVLSEPQLDALLVEANSDTPTG
jgi:hypothetical protein